METRLTVFFDDPFWVGIFERIDDGKLSVCKVTFGAEPKDYEVWEHVLKHYYRLEFSPAVPELKVVSDIIFVKTKANALTSEAFSGYIRENGLDEFYITGADATGCVKSTCFNMAKAGFRVHAGYSAAGDPCD